MDNTEASSWTLLRHALLAARYGLRLPLTITHDLDRTRKHPYPDIRRIAAWLLAQEAGYTQGLVGELMRGRHASTICHAITSHHDLAESDEKYRAAAQRALLCFRDRTEIYNNATVWDLFLPDQADPSGLLEWLL